VIHLEKGQDVEGAYHVFIFFIRFILFLEFLGRTSTHTVDGPAKSCITKRMVETQTKEWDVYHLSTGILMGFSDKPTIFGCCSHRFQLVKNGFRWPIHLCWFSPKSQAVSSRRNATLR